MKRFFELQCTTCKYRAAVKATSARAAGEEFTRCGWQVVGRAIICPSCLKRQAEAPAVSP